MNISSCTLHCKHEKNVFYNFNCVVIPRNDLFLVVVVAVVKMLQIHRSGVPSLSYMITQKIVPPVCARKCALKPVGLLSRTPAHMKHKENTIKTHTKHTKASQITPGKHIENAGRTQRIHIETHKDLLGFCQEFASILPAYPQDSARILKGFSSKLL